MLYNPVKKFMDRRKEYYQGLYDEAHRQKEEADGIKEEYERRLKEVDSEIIAVKQKANEEARTEAAKKLDAAKAEGDRIIAKARKEAESEKQRIVSDVSDEINDLVGEAIDKMLKSSSGDAIDDFLDTVKR